MAARVSASLSQGPPQGEGQHELSAGHRVVSVSPRLVNAQDHETQSANTVHSEGDSLRFPVIETIRADYRASDALISLIELSRQTAHGLRELIEQGHGCERKTTRSALHLQERLRLSARMMQAFQMQIGRLEKGLADLREHERLIQAFHESFQQQLAYLQAQAELVIAGAERRMNESAEKIRARFDA